MLGDKGIPGLARWTTARGQMGTSIGRDLGENWSLGECTEISEWRIVHRGPRRPRHFRRCSTTQAPVPAHGGPAFSLTHGSQFLSS